MHLDTIIFICPKKDFGYFKKEIGGGFGDSLQILMPVEYDWLKIVPEGIVCIQEGKQQVIGKDGKTVVRPFVYDAILPCIILLENISIMEKKG